MTNDLPPDDPERVPARRGGACEICGHPFELAGPFHQLCVDRDPETGTVAGLLCGICWELVQADRSDPTFIDRYFDLHRQIRDGTLPRRPLPDDLALHVEEQARAENPGLDADDPGSPDDK
jgi:hypothetical protein